MINCISCDKNKENRESVAAMLRKIKELRLVKAYAGLDTAAKVCLENNIRILFINLYDFPVPKKDIAVLRKMVKCGIQIIMMSGKIGVMKEAFDFDAGDYIMFPTSAHRLWRASMKALKIIDHGIDTSRMNRENLIPN